MKKHFISNHNRIASLLMAGVMTCALPLAGCSNPNNPGGNTTEAETKGIVSTKPEETTNPRETTEPMPTEAEPTETGAAGDPKETGEEIEPTKETPREKSELTGEAKSALAWQYDHLTLDLMTHAIKDANENVMISPLSILTALSMTANGANGETLREMEQVLGGELNISQLNELIKAYSEALPSSEEAKLAIANSIWYKDAPGVSIREDFLKANQKYYSAGIFPAAFDNQTVTDINNWVNENTDGMIKKLLDEISPANRMILINAILFDGKWEQQYYEDDVWELPFTDAAGNTKNVKQMVSTEYTYLSDKDCTGFMKSYKGGKYAFVGLLGNDGMSPDELLSKMSEEQLQNLFKNAQDRKVYVRIPKFTFDYSLTMNDILKSMGMKQAFDPELADFSGMTDNDRFVISKVLHKTRVEVTEKGTRAAAVTGVMVDTCAMPEPEEVPEVYLNRPFVFMIVDTDLNLPIFIGRVNTIDEQ